MYVPPHFAAGDPAVVLAHLRSTAFGHLVSAAPDGTFESTPLPFLVDDHVSEVRAHLARANRHWRSLDGSPAILVVPGPDAYVSPSWYPSKRVEPAVVPTWNYEVVHLHGTMRVHDEPSFCEQVVRDLTEHHEHARLAVADPDSGAPPSWAVDDAPAEFIARQLRAIVGIAMSVEKVEAKRKLSQNRQPDDRQAVAAALVAAPDPRSRAVGGAMRSIDA